jgi:hypothetical protein
VHGTVASLQSVAGNGKWAHHILSTTCAPIDRIGFRLESQPSGRRRSPAAYERLMSSTTSAHRAWAGRSLWKKSAFSTVLRDRSSRRTRSREMPKLSSSRAAALASPVPSSIRAPPEKQDAGIGVAATASTTGKTMYKEPARAVQATWRTH